MKPLVLEVFPKAPPRPNPASPEPPDGWLELCNWEAFRSLEDLYRDIKRLTDAELAAEYHQQAAYVEARTHQTTAAHDTRNRDRLDTLYRFATQPSYDQEPTND